MRSTKAEFLMRVEEVYKLLLGGATFPDLREFARAPERNWTVCDAQIRRYMTAAHQLMRERFDAKADYSLNRHMLRREQLFAHAVGTGDFSTALRVLDSEARLERLITERHEHAGKAGAPVVLVIHEELVSRQPPPALPGIVEEVVTRAATVSS